jgi:hypothetical protein
MEGVYEREADQVAEQVLRAEAPPVEASADAARPAPPRLRPGAGAPLGPSPAGVRDVIAAGGQPLDDVARAFMEPRFGHDFGQVRIHTDARAAESARRLNAAAYTVGKHIVFGAGRYQPNAEAGRLLLAHELTHVLQQEAGAGSAPVQKQDDLTRGGPEYTVDDAIARLELALSVAQMTLADPDLDADRRSLIERQVARLQPVLEQLPGAQGADGAVIAFDFDPNPRENEINPGDADKSIDELFAGVPAPGVEGAGPDETGAVLLAWALPGGLQITPTAGPAVQLQADPVTIIIIILAGLLLSGCRDSDKQQPAPPSAPPPPPSPSPTAPTAPPTPTRADQCTFGEIGQWAITSVADFTPPAGLADAKASIDAACSRQRCNCIDGSTKTAPGDRHAWTNILVATGGTDQTAGGNFMCVGNESCWFVHSCGPDMRHLRERATPLTPVGTVVVNGHRLFFYSDPLLGQCPQPPKHH